jgi:hypothetical protein
MPHTNREKRYCQRRELFFERIRMVCHLSLQALAPILTPSIPKQPSVALQTSPNCQGERCGDMFGRRAIRKDPQSEKLEVEPWQHCATAENGIRSGQVTAARLSSGRSTGTARTDPKSFKASGLLRWVSSSRETLYVRLRCLVSVIACIDGQRMHTSHDVSEA